jgi:hypothetical protein
MSNELEELEKQLDELQEIVTEALGPTDDIAKDDSDTISDADFAELESEVDSMIEEVDGAIGKYAQTSWDERVQKIANEENVPTTVAMQKARVQYPDAFELLQKSAPMGNNRIHGYAPDPEKARAVRSEFISAVKEIARNSGLSRTESFRKARETHPDLFARFQKGE